MSPVHMRSTAFMGEAASWSADTGDAQGAELPTLLSAIAYTTSMFALATMASSIHDKRDISLDCLDHLYLVVIDKII